MATILSIVGSSRKNSRTFSQLHRGDQINVRMTKQSSKKWGRAYLGSAGQDSTDFCVAIVTKDDASAGPNQIELPRGRLSQAMSQISPEFASIGTEPIRSWLVCSIFGMLFGKIENLIREVKKDVAMQILMQILKKSARRRGELVKLPVVMVSVA